MSRIMHFDGLACVAIEGSRVISPVPREDAVVLARPSMTMPAVALTRHH
jgi:hypothetical protein